MSEALVGFVAHGSHGATRQALGAVRSIDGP